MEDRKESGTEGSQALPSTLLTAGMDIPFWVITMYVPNRGSLQDSRKGGIKRNAEDDDISDNCHDILTLLEHKRKKQRIFSYHCFCCLFSSTGCHLCSVVLIQQTI